MDATDRAEWRALSAKVDTLSARMDVLSVKFDAIIESQRDHEARIRSTERWKLSIPISVLLALATVVGGFIGRGG